MGRIDQRGNAPKSDAQRNAQAYWQEKQAAKLATLKDNQEARAKRTPQQQLDLLDAKLGEGVGAKKERARLLKKIAKEQETEDAFKTKKSNEVKLR